MESLLLFPFPLQLLAFGKYQIASCNYVITFGKIVLAFGKNPFKSAFENSRHPRSNLGRRTKDERKRTKDLSAFNYQLSVFHYLFFTLLGVGASIRNLNYTQFVLSVAISGFYTSQAQ
jgi:hypothetical protein